MFLHHLGSRVFSQQLKDMKVPVKYHDFQCLLSSKITLINKRQEDGPPILTWQQMLRYMWLTSYICKLMFSALFLTASIYDVMYVYTLFTTTACYTGWLVLIRQRIHVITSAMNKSSDWPSDTWRRLVSLYYVIWCLSL